MTVESKIVITAEDRTAAAFAAIERNTGRTSEALLAVTRNALKLAGVGTLIAFFRQNAESTEKWRNEMERLDDVTKKYFNTVADAGQLDPLINGIKTIYSAATGASRSIIIFGQGVAAFGRDVKLLGTDFWQSGREIAVWKRMVDEAHASQIEFDKSLFEKAPQGYVKQKEAEAERLKKISTGLKKSEEERFKMTLDNARPAEDAFRAESETDITGAGADAMVKAMFQSKFEKEQELRLRASEANQQQRDKDIEALLTSQLTETDITNQKYANDLQSLYDARESEYLTEVQFKQARETLEMEHQAKMGDASAQGALQRRKFEEMSSQQKTDFILNDMIRMTAGVATHSKAMFKINKMATIASIALGIPDAVQKAYSAYPPPYSFVAGALQLAASMSNLNQAKNAQFESASSAPSIGGGSAMPVTTADSVPALPQGTMQTPAREMNITIHYEGMPPSDEWMRSSFLPVLNEAYADGAAQPRVIIA